ncbi:hypothetical protein DERP_008080 [Dermatophagoides pteronyssinus]|uniref:Uncharacterized protein n=1 Tax=Dermatophagoides pteronyssinus TaxID=6956 RepID=A0ABQ8JK52_DERPT|nr:hypothetical protein DERP_008080 [Dermatophagoides pteronyssinus]
MVLRDLMNSWFNSALIEFCFICKFHLTQVLPTDPIRCDDNFYHQLTVGILCWEIFIMKITFYGSNSTIQFTVLIIIT